MMGLILIAALVAPPQAPKPPQAPPMADNCGQYTCPANGGKGGCKCVEKGTCGCVIARKVKAVTVYRFTLRTCLPCRAFEPTFRLWSTRHPGVRFVDVDCSENPGLSQRYGVTSVPALVVTNGERYWDRTGVPTEAEFVAAVKVLQEGK